MLHLANGESTIQLLRDAHVPGDIRSGDGIFMEGPLPNGLREADDWRVRAQWVEAHLAVPKADFLVGHARVERALRAAADADEVVVWSEEDVFCQVNLLYLLTRLASAKSPVSLVCPPVVHLGVLTENEVHRAFLARAPIDPARFALARRAWEAFCSPDPRDVAHLLPELAAQWPAMGAALRRHLERFPSARDGLGAHERMILETLAARPLALRDLMPAVTALPALDAYGMGDVSVLGLLNALARGDRPLLSVDDPRAVEDPASGGVWALTDDARRVLAGADAVALRGADGWLGGARLEGRDVWRWDAERGALVPPAPGA